MPTITPTFTIWLMLTMTPAGNIALRGQYWSAEACAAARTTYTRRNEGYMAETGAQPICYRMELPQPPVGKKG